MTTTDTNNTDGAALLPVTLEDAERSGVGRGDEAFCSAVWDALKGDHNDLRRQQIILNAHRKALSTPQRQEYDGEAVREALERFLADYDDGDRADAGVHPLMEAHIADFRAALAHPAQATPSALSGDAGEVETTVAAIVAHLRTRADGFRAAAKKQGKRVGPMAKGFDWAALEIESTFAALPSHQGAGE